MPATWCSAVEKILSEAHRRVHAPNTTDFKSWSFLKPVVVDKGFERQGIQPKLQSGFQAARIEAMPNNTFHSPKPLPMTPPSGSHLTLPAAGGAALAPTAQPMALGAVDEQALESARAEAFEAGLAQGREEGKQAALLEQATEQQTLAQEQEQQVKSLLSQIQQGMTELRQDEGALFEPLKQLALHLAEELVLGDLATSPQAIDRLVQRCVDTLDSPASTPLLIQLSPSDLDVLRNHPEVAADRPEHWTWEVDSHMLPGSVRIKVNDTVVNDLVEHRLTALAQSLLKPSTPWAAQSAFNPDRFAQRQSLSRVEDVEARTPQTAPPVAPDPERFAEDDDTTGLETTEAEPAPADLSAYRQAFEQDTDHA